MCGYKNKEVLIILTCFQSCVSVKEFKELLCNFPTFQLDWTLISRDPLRSVAVESETV